MSYRAVTRWSWDWEGVPLQLPCVLMLCFLSYKTSASGNYPEAIPHLTFLLHVHGNFILQTVKDGNRDVSFSLPPMTSSARREERKKKHNKTSLFKQRQKWILFTRASHWTRPAIGPSAAWCTPVRIVRELCRHSWQKCPLLFPSFFGSSPADRLRGSNPAMESFP